MIVTIKKEASFIKEASFFIGDKYLF